MKCPVCKHEMVRKQRDEHNFYYECNYCHKIIGNAVHRDETPEDIKINNVQEDDIQVGDNEEA